MQEDQAERQDDLSVKLGIGLEHQLPHLYSQVAVGEVVTVVVQREAVVFVEAEAC